MAQAAQAVPTGHHYGQPGWDEQIVPALRQRLQNESAELSSRLSQASFPDEADTSLYTHYPPSGPSASSSSATRQRTTSTPLGMSAPAPSRIPQPSAYRAAHAQLTGANGASRTGGGHSRSNPPVRPAPGSRQNSTGSTSDRGHSRTAQMKLDGASAASGERPAPMSRQNSAGPSGSDRYLQPSAERGALQNRDSFDLSATNLPDVSIRNELPPFRMNPEEAMRIAQRGHVREEDGGDGASNLSEESDGFVDRYKEGYRSRRADGLMDDGEEVTPRKRSESMSPVAGLPSSSRPPGSSALASSGFAGLGKGTPSSRTGSAPKRNATGPSSKPLTSSTTTRSASHNMLSSSTSSAPSSRIRAGGVAAHLVPPESSFTPPKNANWDDVVLPAVAKKMALGSSPTRHGLHGGGGDEEELAVEWDKDGVPIKWAKAGGSGSTRTRPGGAGGAGNEDAPSGSTITTKAGSSFSPTFDPSPDNPMNPSTVPGARGRYPAPPLGERQDHDVNYDNAMRQYGLGGGSDVPPSPAPFAHYGVDTVTSGKENLAPHTPNGMLQHQQSYASIRSNGLAPLGPGVGVSPGRQQSYATLRHQGSYHSMDPQQTASTPVRGVVAGGTRAAGGGEHGWQEYPTPPASHRGNRGPEWGPIEGGKGKGKGKKDGEHGSGCGCAIM